MRVEAAWGSLSSPLPRKVRGHGPARGKVLIKRHPENSNKTQQPSKGAWARTVGKPTGVNVAIDLTHLGSLHTRFLKPRDGCMYPPRVYLSTIQKVIKNSTYPSFVSVKKCAVHAVGRKKKGQG